MKLLMEGETATETEDTARQKGKVIRCGLDGMCGRTKNVSELEGLDDNYVCDFCTCDVCECVRILNYQETPTTEIYTG
jgi:hypothetical protein